MTGAEVAMLCVMVVWLLAIAAGKSAGAYRHHCSQTLSHLGIEAACLSQTSAPVHVRVNIMKYCNWIRFCIQLHAKIQLAMLCGRESQQSKITCQGGSNAVTAELMRQLSKTASKKRRTD
jgi:hypothetical protein